jgi:4a-hydroxytetrahydrobiopterin dehydratase
MDDLKPLSIADIEQKLKDFPGWVYASNKLSKEFEFKNFLEGLDLVNKLGQFSEKIDHHPDIHIFYNKILFELQRFDIGGKVTTRDFTIAQKIEELYKNR